MRLPERVLDRPAPEGVRWLALVRLDDLIAARQRLDDTGDAKALHDFRVALRRFRSLLRTCRAVLDDSVARKSRRRLSLLADATGLSRDSEVRLEWLHQHVKHGPSNAAGLAWVEGELDRDRIKGQRRFQRALDQVYAPVVEQLRRTLQQFRTTTTLGKVAAVVPTRTVIARALHRLAKAVQKTLDQARAARDPERMHRVRIAAKRLRYALEPLVDDQLAAAGIRQTAAAAIAQLKRTQDALGDLHDELAFEQWLAGAEPDEGPKCRAQTAFIGRLLRRLHRQAERRYRTLDGPPWRHRIDRILQRAHTVADRLARTRRAPPAGLLTQGVQPATSRPLPGAP